MLSNLFINNIPYSFENTLSDPFVLPNGTKLNSLLFADDLVILSRSKTGLQTCLNRLSSYCNSWMLKSPGKSNQIGRCLFRCTRAYQMSCLSCFCFSGYLIGSIDHFHYDVTRAKVSGSCSKDRAQGRSIGGKFKIRTTKTHAMQSASRGPFSFVFAELTGGTKRDLCHGSKLPLIQPPSMVVDGGFRNACSLYCLLTVT